MTPGTRDPRFGSPPSDNFIEPKVKIKKLQRRQFDTIMHESLWKENNQFCQSDVAVVAAHSFWNEIKFIVHSLHIERYIMH